MSLNQWLAIDKIILRYLWHIVKILRYSKHIHCMENARKLQMSFVQSGGENYYLSMDVNLFIFLRFWGLSSGPTP
jgi:hypothetical protein